MAGDDGVQVVGRIVYRQLCLKVIIAFRVLNCGSIDHAALYQNILKCVMLYRQLHRASVRGCAGWSNLNALPVFFMRVFHNPFLWDIEFHWFISRNFRTRSSRRPIHSV